MTLPIRLRLDQDTWLGDLVRYGGQFQVDAGFETAVLISLFTYRRAEDDDELPGRDEDRQGWWGDSYDDDDQKIGSRLWLLRRSKATRETIAAAKRYVEEALAWMLSDGVASSVVVEVERIEVTVLAIRITITKSEGTKYDTLWKVKLDAL